MKPTKQVLIFMGVSGVGKSTTMTALYEKLQEFGVKCSAFEGDSYHPASNVEKLSVRKLPLDDADRWPWLENIVTAIIEQQVPIVLVSCSALKLAYRDFIRDKLFPFEGHCLFIYLHANRDMVMERITARKEHFMPASLLESQFEALEEPVCGLENHVSIDSTSPLSLIVSTLAEIIQRRIKIAYIYSKNSCKYLSLLPSNRDRSRLVHGLHEAYDLFSRLFVVPPKAATKNELLDAHSEDFIDALLKHPSLSMAELEEYGLVDDCSSFDELVEYCRLVAGGSLTAADLLLKGECRIAINWDGGRHHAKQGSASGFCYVNDVVLAINQLRRKFHKVLYIDVDIHHGDGVQEAFEYSKQVFTLSFHRKTAGFFPGSGDALERGNGMGSGYNRNIILPEFCTDDFFIKFIRHELSMVFQEFRPEAVVIVAGLDGLAVDPVKQWSLTYKSYLYLVDLISAWSLPSLWLGGGGYNSAACAKVWTMMTARLANVQLDQDIPIHENMDAFMSDLDLIPL